MAMSAQHLGKKCGSAVRGKRLENKKQDMKKAMRFVSVLLLVCISMVVCGCGSNGTSKSSKKVYIDYGDAESFEAALNEGQNLEGKVVRFVVSEFHPKSLLGYNLWAGEHLNFISASHPDVQANDVVTVRATSIRSSLGSWIIEYEKVDNAKENKKTIKKQK